MNKGICPLCGNSSWRREEWQLKSEITCDICNTPSTIGVWKEAKKDKNKTKFPSNKRNKYNGY